MLSRFLSRYRNKSHKEHDTEVAQLRAKLGEKGIVGVLGNGAQISAGFERSGNAIGVSVSNLQSAVRGSVNFKALEAGAQNFAKAEGATSVTIKAVNVTNAKLAKTLVSAGYKAQQMTDNFGRTTVNYVKTVNF